MENTSLSTLCESTIQKALTFLGGIQNHDGTWSDFLLEGGSDEWVTAVVGSVLAGSGYEDAEGWSRRAWENFGIRNLFDGHGGWGYNARCPEDADSTAWGIRFANQLGLMEAGRTRLAVEALLKYVTPDGGLTTYIHDGEVSRFIGIPSPDLSGWKCSHTCNTSAAATLPQLNNILCPYVLARQLPNGNWDSFWYPDTVFSTTYAIETLRKKDPILHRKAIVRAGNWILRKAGNNSYIGNRFLPEGSPFATALGLKGLILSGQDLHPDGKPARLLSWLMNNQREDGSWEPSVFMVVIPPNHTSSFRDESPDEFPERWEKRVYPDIRSVMTTAFVLDSLLTILKTSGR